MHWLHSSMLTTSGPSLNLWNRNLTSPHFPSQYPVKNITEDSEPGVTCEADWLLLSHRSSEGQWGGQEQQLCAPVLPTLHTSAHGSLMPAVCRPARGSLWRKGKAELTSSNCEPLDSWHTLLNSAEGERMVPALTEGVCSCHSPMKRGRGETECLDWVCECDIVMRSFYHHMLAPIFSHINNYKADWLSFTINMIIWAGGCGITRVRSFDTDK